MAALLTTRGLGRRGTESTLNPSFGLGFGAPVGPVVVEIGDVDLTLASPAIGSLLFRPSLLLAVASPTGAGALSSPTVSFVLQAPSVTAMTCAPSVDACLTDPAGSIAIGDAGLDADVRPPGVV